MKEDFKKWLSDKAGYLYLAYQMLEEKGMNNEVELLIKAMWAVNREKDYLMEITDAYITVQDPDWRIEPSYFLFKDYNNSEQKALTAALEYVYKESQDG